MNREWVRCHCNKRFTFDFAECKLSNFAWNNKKTRSRRSALPFDQRGCLAIERGVIGFARSQIKFVDNDVDERGGRHSQKNPEQSEHRRGCERKEQDGQTMSDLGAAGSE